MGKAATGHPHPPTPSHPSYKQLLLLEEREEGHCQGIYLHSSHQQFKHAWHTWHDWLHWALPCSALREFVWGQQIGGSAEMTHFFAVFLCLVVHTLFFFAPPPRPPHRIFYSPLLPSPLLLFCFLSHSLIPVLIPIASPLATTHTASRLPALASSCSPSPTLFAPCHQPKSPLFPRHTRSVIIDHRSLWPQPSSVCQ